MTTVKVKYGQVNKIRDFTRALKPFHERKTLIHLRENMKYFKDNFGDDSRVVFSDTNYYPIKVRDVYFIIVLI